MIYYSIEQLTKKAKSYAMKYWGLEFDIPIKQNNRLKAVNAQCIFTLLDVPTHIEFGRPIMTGLYTKKTTYKILKHELVHWAMAKLGRCFDDGVSEFEEECKRIGACSNYDTKKELFVGYVNMIRCSKCHKIIMLSEGKQFISNYFNSNKKTKCCTDSSYYEKDISIYEGNMPKDIYQYLYEKE